MTKPCDCSTNHSAMQANYSSEDVFITEVLSSFSLSV